MHDFLVDRATFLNLLNGLKERCASVVLSYNAQDEPRKVRQENRSATQTCGRPNAHLQCRVLVALMAVVTRKALDVAFEEASSRCGGDSKHIFRETIGAEVLS